MEQIPQFLGHKDQTGPQGLPGRCWTTRTDGTKGPQGPQGEEGEQGPTGPTGSRLEIKVLKDLQGAAGPQGIAGPQGAVGPDGPQVYKESTRTCRSNKEL